MKVDELIKSHPIIREMAEGKEIAWFNPELTDYTSSMKNISVTISDIEDADKRLRRFAPFIMKCFPETQETKGLIESPLKEIENMKKSLEEVFKCNINGRLFLKMDSELAVAGSVKARGGIYEILKYAETLAIEHGMISYEDDYSKFADKEFKDLFSKYAVHVGSTGNLGLSIGIISAALGFNVYVHMSADAKQWKKDLLRSKGVNVIEYAGDYGKAVKEGRALAEKTPNTYFVDDESSRDLFLGYAVAAGRLERQLIENGIKVDAEHPLIVYIPCGVGGAPGGVAFGLKQIYKDNVYIIFVEPTEACCMALGMITDLHNEICVQDIGLSGITEADGLAVGRPSKFVGQTIRHMLAGEFTVKDSKLYKYLRLLDKSEGIFIEPSSCAGFEGPVGLSKYKEAERFISDKQLDKVINNCTQIVWATGGSLVPDDIREEYLKKVDFNLNI